MLFDYQFTLDAIDADTATGAVVPPSVRGLYTKGDDGKFSLDADLRKKVDVSGLTTALDKERKTAKNLNDSLKLWAPLGDSPEAVKARIDELTEAATKGDKVNLDKIRADMDKTHKTALDAKDGVITGMKGTLEKYLVNGSATAAIAELKGVPELLLPHVTRAVKVVEAANGEYVVRVVDADGDFRGDGKGGFMSIKDLVAEMKGSSVFGRAFEASGTTGGGKQPGSGKGAGAGSSNTEGMSSVQKIALGLGKGQLARQ